MVTKIGIGLIKIIDARLQASSGEPRPLWARRMQDTHSLAKSGVPECRDWNPFTSGKLLMGGRLEFRDRSVGAFVPWTKGVCKPIPEQLVMARMTSPSSDNFQNRAAPWNQCERAL